MLLSLPTFYFGNQLTLSCKLPDILLRGPIVELREELFPKRIHLVERRQLHMAISGVLVWDVVGQGDQF